MRGRDDVLRAFYNVCRHRGTAVVEEACGTAVRFQCPYHAWIYDLEGKLVRAKHTEDLDDFSLDGFGLVPVRLATWQGFVFVSLDPEAPALEPTGWATSSLISAGSTSASLRVAHEVAYEVDANWKFIAENYSECYHCPGIHPQLNKLTPYDLGGDFAPDGPWQGGWMELVDNAETMALDGGHATAGRRCAGITELDERRIYYYLRLAVDVPVDPPGLPARPSAGAGRAGSHPDRLPVAVRARDDRRRGLRPVGRGRVLGPHEPPGLARLRAPAPGHPVAQLDGRPVLEPGAERPRVRSHGGRPLRRRRRRSAGGPSAQRYDVPAPKPGEEQDRMAEGNVPAVPLPRSAARIAARAKAR